MFHRISSVSCNGIQLFLLTLELGTLLHVREYTFLMLSKSVVYQGEICEALKISK